MLDSRFSFFLLGVVTDSIVNYIFKLLDKREREKND